MIGKNICRCLKRDITEMDWLRRNLNNTLASGLVGRLCVFAPYIEPIASRGNVVNRDASVLAGYAVIRRAERQNDSSHLRVNIAEDVGNAIAIKPDCSVGMSFIEAEVKAFSIKERKNIVVEGVKVGEVYTAAGRHDENMRCELLIFLLKRVALRCTRR